MDLDVDRFIFEIKQRPAIWDTNCDDYSDRLEKMKKWEEIINIFTDESTSHKERRTQGQFLQKRWKTLRDAFVKERRQIATTKSGSASTNKKRYKYYKKLLFLLPVISFNTTQNSMASEEDNDSDDKQPEPKKTKKSDPTENMGNNLVNVFKSTLQQKTQEEDPDRLFMLSLVNDFKRVSPRLKPMVKINILKCIIEAQDEMYDSQQVQRADNSSYLYSNQLHEGCYTTPQQKVKSRRPSDQPSTSSNRSCDQQYEEEEYLE